ncbi:Nuf2 family-domain-containing protein [Rhodotorula diobovata]|uniref:Nuf2 family-domain-containing protein n=1 Tax=Rhodotorula diobovata TaxID=5288 RepID=A0A5C5G7U9_9BASI|nr:Nuf2 family-domain-containing protein [Rhodotorula diobovata]
MSLAPAMQGTFPLLDLDELHHTLVDFGCQIQLDDLTRPTPARTQAIYEWWMERLLGLRAEDVRRAADQQLDQLDHPEIYRDAMYIGVFQIAFQQLTRPCGLGDFTLNDLTHPTSKRLIQVLSAIVNFNFFAEEQGDRVFRPLEDEFDKLAQEEGALIEENERLRDKIADERASRAANAKLMQAEEPAEQASVDALNDKRAAALALNKTRESVRADMTALVQRRRDIAQDVARLELGVAELRSQIVSSPEKLRGRIDEMQEQLARETDMLKDTEAKERQTTAKINALAQYSLELHACIRILDDWQTDVDKLREAELRLGEHTDHLRALEAEQVELENRIQLLERRIANGRDELVRMRDKMERKKDAARQRKKALEDAHADNLRRKEDLDMEAAEKNAQATEVEMQIRSMHSSLQVELEKGEKAFKRIKDQVTLYSIRLNKALDSINELNSLAPEI